MITNEHVNHAINYILAHINEDLSVDKIASHCNFSKYYFSRVFKSETGESIGGFIKRIKMEQSAFRLKVERSRSITEIGGDYGYSSSNYSSAFRQHHALSPYEFRRHIMKRSLTHPVFSDASVSLESFEACSRKISRETLPDFHVIYHRHKGNYGNLSEHWGDFLEKYSGYITGQTLFLECSYDDPSITDGGGCLCDLYMTAPENCGLENTCVIKGGKFAVYHFMGSVKQIYTAYQSIFNIWLPQSGHEIDGRYSFGIYRQVDNDAMKMEIDICIPIK